MSYTKQGFYEGMTLEHTHLINMEDGIINATSTQIPEYWQSYMDAKIKEINTLNENSGGAADSFIFIADTHLPSHGNGNSINLMKYIIENTSVNKIIFGGDIIHPTSAAEGLTTARQLAKDLKNVNYYPIRGNHDKDYNNENQYYDILYRPSQHRSEMSSTLDYYVDNQAQKIRYIIMDSTASSASQITTSNAQVEWMKNLIMELDDSWTVLIVRHSIWIPVQNSPLGDPGADAQLIIDALDSIYDTAECTIAGILAGHVHRDNYELSDKGYALITTTCDCKDYAPGYDTITPNRPTGTTEEHAFDVVNFNPQTGLITTIRIGAGADRSMVYTIPRTEMDLSALTWEQGHYGSDGIDTADTHQYYNYRLRSNILEIPEAARGRTLIFDILDDFEINLRCGVSSTDLTTFNYFLITSDKSNPDRGSNTGNRGYMVKLPSTVTHMRMMLSYDDGSSTGSNNTKAIVPADASNAGLKIWY